MTGGARDLGGSSPLAGHLQGAARQAHQPGLLLGKLWHHAAEEGREGDVEPHKDRF